MNAANKGIVTPDLMDLVETDVASLGTFVAAVPSLGTFVGAVQGPAYTVPDWVKDTVAGPLVVGLHVTGTEGADTIYGTSRADDLSGLGGNDAIHGGAGNDHIDGGYGDDLLHGGAGADTLVGGGGWDTVSYAGSSAVTLNLQHGGGLGGDAQGDILIDIAHVIGSSFGDVIIGDSSFNTLDGRAGNDILIGGDGGGNRLIGGLGFDTLTGGWGTDTFIFTPGSQLDHITDFEQGSDTIDLTAFAIPNYEFDVFGYDGELATGRISASGNLSATHGLDPSDRVFFDLETMTLYQCSYVATDLPWLGDVEYTLFLGDAILSVDAADVSILRTDDFFLG